MKSLRQEFAVLGLALLIGVGTTGKAQAQKQSMYPKMGPVDSYLMPRDAEIALARSAAPESISRDAEVLVMTRQGYETAAKGSNGFVCIVQRSWTAPSDDPEFWNPKVRAPICYNQPAARSYLLGVVKETELALGGRSGEQISEAIKADLDAKRLPALESGSMCYMMSKDGYLNDKVGHWHSHLMFLVPETDEKLWGANLRNSPILASKDDNEHVTVFMIPIGKWSDGTSAPPMNDDQNGQP